MPMASALVSANAEALAADLEALDADVARILPRKVDRERFGALMAIVAASTDDNIKLAALREKLDEVGSVLLRVLKELL